MNWIVRLFLVAAIGGFGTIASAQTAPTVSVPVAAAKAYAFRINSDGLVLAPNGTPVAAADLPAYFKGLGVAPGTTLALWIDGPEAVKKLAPTIKVFGPDFTKIVVKQWQPGDTVGPIDPATLPKSSLQAVIKAAYPGQTYAAVEPGAALDASLAKRPLELRPGQIPDHIRYRYADAAAVAETAQRLSRHFLTAGSGAETIWAGAVVVQAEAWKRLQDDSGLGHQQAIRFQVKLPTANGPAVFPQIILRDANEIRELDAKLWQIVAEDGGGRVRALHGDEMSAWWPFISYDITEPIFVLETNQKHRFIFGFTREGIGMVDELSGLYMSPPKADAKSPDAPAKPAGSG